MSKDYKATFVPGMVDGLSIDAEKLDIALELERLKIVRDIRVDTEKMFTGIYSTTTGEDPAPITPENIRGMIAIMPSPACDEIVCRRPMDIWDRYPDDVSFGGGIWGNPTGLSFCGVPIRFNKFIPRDLVAFFLDGKLVGVERLSEC